MAQHLAMLPDLCAALPANPGELGAMPLIVISGAHLTPEQQAEQASVARLSTAGRHVIAEGSGHWVHLDRPDLVVAAVKILGEKVRCCIAVDSRDPATVDLALAAYPYKAMCNTVTGEWDNLRTMLPIIARHGAALGSALVYEKGVPQTVGERLSVASRIVEAALEHGIPRADIIIDAVCLPGSVAPGSLTVTLETIRAIRAELGVPVLLGISNAGCLMPNPRLIDLAYFIASAAWGLDVAMIDPFTPQLEWLSPAMDFLLGTDPAARGYLGVFRAARAMQPARNNLETDFGANPPEAGADRAGGEIAAI